MATTIAAGDGDDVRGTSEGIAAASPIVKLKIEDNEGAKETKKAELIGNGRERVVALSKERG